VNQILELLPPLDIALPPIGVGLAAALFSFYFLWRRPLNVHVTVVLYQHLCTPIGPRS